VVYSDLGDDVAGPPAADLVSADSDRCGHAPESTRVFRGPTAGCPGAERLPTGERRGRAA
jgi:hypothetical protein